MQTRTGRRVGNWLYCTVCSGLIWQITVSALVQPSRVLADDAGALRPVAGKSTKSPTAEISGRELFLREWVPNDPRSHGGDGLGPVFNDTSCVSCHNQGGVAGGGSEAKNVIVITAFRANATPTAMRAGTPAAAPADQAKALPTPAPRSTTVPAGQLPAPPGAAPQPPLATIPDTDAARKERERIMLLAELKQLHPGLAVARSVVLHKSGTDPQYAAWRDKALGIDTVAASMRSMPPRTASAAGSGFFSELARLAEVQAQNELLPPADLMAEKVRGLLSGTGMLGMRGNPRGGANTLFTVPTQRNATALFGAGLIDSIPDSVLEATAKKTSTEFPEISGRVARLKNGKIGRFGWKAQTTSLYDFTMTACAVELGLHVPDHAQAGVPQNPEYQPAGFDLNQDECLALVKFLKELPAPARLPGDLPILADDIRKGEEHFTKIGCAACHQPKLGEVAGIFSDLLVHDMGPEGADSGSYGVFQPQSPGKDADDPLAGLLNEAPLNPFQSMQRQGVAQLPEEPIPENMIGAGRQEWRTPPLWGVRDSAPYMHDGRAKSLEQAIAFHGGEAQLSANRFYRLKSDDRSQLLTFLRSLVAPETLAAARR